MGLLKGCRADSRGKANAEAFPDGFSIDRRGAACREGGTTPRSALHLQVVEKSFRQRLHFAAAQAIMLISGQDEKRG